MKFLLLLLGFALPQAGRCQNAASCLALLIVAIPFTPAQAGIVQLSFSGTVSSFLAGSGSALPDRFSLGTPARIDLAYESTAPVSQSSANANYYDLPVNALSYFRAVVGDAKFAATTYFRAEVFQASFTDKIEYLAFSPATSLSLPAGIYLSSMNTQFWDDSATALSNKNLPTSLTLGDWSPARFKIQAGNSATGLVDSEMIVTITSTEVPVPEIDPASFGSAFALLMGSMGIVERRVRRVLGLKTAA
jgi:hypothetical protein